MNDRTDSVDLVGQIAGFTSLRDVDLLELSLLKSIYTMVNPKQVSLICLDSNNIILKRVDYSAEKHGNISVKEKANEQLLEACERLEGSNLEYCTTTSQEHSLTLFMLSHTRKLAHMITVESHSFGVTKTMSQQILGMLRIYRNFKKLLQESQTDELTGLNNRKSFDEFVRKIHDALQPGSEVIAPGQRACSNPERYWLALIDIDNFKDINDTHGHLMGDEVLVRLSQSMQMTLREEDLLFRYGGEEFAVIYKSADRDSAIAIMERLRKDIETIQISQIGSLSVSIGITEMKRDIFHLKLVEMADKALYQSKDTGKNKVSFCNNVGSGIRDSAANENELF